MKIGIIGSGTVGQTLGTALAGQGEEIVLGTRTPDRKDEKRGRAASLGEWVRSTGGKGTIASFADTASHGEIVINATAGDASLEALALAGAGNLRGKILIDAANPLDFSAGMPPTLTVCNRDSLGEQIQRAFPDVRVVKALNTVNALVMVAPRQVAGGEHDLFMCGDDADAKKEVASLLKRWFGWCSIIDLGDISNSRGMEMLLPLWIRLWGALGTPMFNFRIVR